MFKKKNLMIWAAALIWLLVPFNALALFGEDIVYLIQMIRVGTQTYEQARQTQETVTQMARTVAHPGSWKNVITNGVNGVDGYLTTASTGMDQHSLDTLRASVEAARGAIHDTASMGNVLTTSDAINLATVNLEAANTKIEADKQQAKLQYYSDLSWYGQRENGTQISTGWVPRRGN